MNVIDAARSLGLTATSEVTGTIDQQHVLKVLAELARTDPDNKDLFDAAARHVTGSRSAGAEAVTLGSTRDGSSERSAIQLRYRSEMAEIFTDLAIDVGLRQTSKWLTADSST